jgi:hypothetical protein
MAPKIRLNFLPLTPQRFIISAWRQGTDPQEKKPDEKSVWRYDLPERPEEPQSDKRTYLIRFAPANGFEPFTLDSHVHRDLSNAALFNALQNQVMATLPGDKFFFSDKAFRPRRMSFVMHTARIGRQVVWIEPYHLEATDEFGFLIDFKFVLDHNVPFSRETQRLSLSLDQNFRSNKDFYVDRFEFVSRFLHEISPRIFPLSVAPGSSVTLKLSLAELPLETLAEKVFLFGGGTDKSASQWNGLNKFGPFAPAPKPIRFIYVYRKHQRTLAEDLYRGLDGKIADFSFPGIQKLTGAQVTGYDKVEMADLSKHDIDAAIVQIVAIASRHKDRDCVVPIFITDKENTDAYYRLKFGLLRNDIPVQVVTAKLIANRSSLKWSVANIALQIFSKAGGTAWHVQPGTKDCLIFGIGQAHKKEGRFVRRYFAYSVCTDSSGAYKRLSILAEGVDKTEYLQQLRQRIVAEVQEMSGQYRHCVIHVPFSIRRDESAAINDALQTAIEQQQLPSIDLSVIKVNMENKFFGYAETNSLVPYAGSVTCLSHTDRSYLAWFDGLQQSREVIQRRIGGPVHVQWLWSSNADQTPEDRRRMLQDLLNLSGANWRGFNAKSEPVSVYYCELIARFSKHSDEVIDHIARLNSPWFL